MRCVLKEDFVGVVGVVGVVGGGDVADVCLIINVDLLMSLMNVGLI